MCWGLVFIQKRPKLTKNDQKTSKMSQNWSKMTENDEKLSFSISVYPLHQVKEVKHGVDRVFYISLLLIINQLKWKNLFYH